VSDLYRLEVEPEVRSFLESLPDQAHAVVEHAVERVVGAPTTLGEPHSRHLGEGLRELRFYLDGKQIRITYRLAPGRRIVLLTVFRKTRQVERAQVERAQQALKVCRTEHEPAMHVYTGRQEFGTRTRQCRTEGENQT